MHNVTFLYGDVTPSPTTPPAVVSATPAPNPVAGDAAAPATARRR